MKHILQLGELEILADTITSPAKVEPFDARYGVFLEILQRGKLVALFGQEAQAVAEAKRINEWILKHPADSPKNQTPPKLEF